MASKLAKALGVSLDELAGHAAFPPPPEAPAPEPPPAKAPKRPRGGKAL